MRGVIFHLAVLLTLITTALPGLAAPPVDGLNRLGLKLLQANAFGDGNAYCSPTSLGIALAMLGSAGQGATGAELAEAVGSSPGSLLNDYGALMEQLANLNQLGLANAVCLHDGQDLNESFAGQLKDSLKARFFQLNQAEMLETANDWVKAQTHGLIPQLLTSRDVPSQSEFILANAVSFEAQWASQFPKELTANLPFKLEGGQVAMVPMMRQTSFFRASGQTEGGDDLTSNATELQAVELPYKGDRVSMLVLVPPKGTLKSFESGLTPEKVEAVLAGLTETNLQLTMPRLRGRARSRLNDSLQALGVRAPFSPKADFSKLYQQGQGASLGSVVHETYVEVDEVGTKAAAATAAVGVRSLPMNLRIDRPFLFIIVDRTTGAFLFLGRVVNPEA